MYLITQLVLKKKTFHHDEAAYANVCHSVTEIIVITGIICDLKISTLICFLTYIHVSCTCTYRALWVKNEV